MSRQSSCSRATVSSRQDAEPELGRSATSFATASISGWSCNSNVLYQPPVKLRPAVPEEAEGGAVLLRLREVESCDQHPGFLRSKLREHVAAFIADEAVAIEALAVLVADAVGRHDGHDIRNGVPDHRSAPQS